MKSNLQKVARHTLGASGYSDIPKLTEEFFTEGKLYRDGKPTEQNTKGKQREEVKNQLTIRLNTEVVDFFRSRGKSWQSSTNKALLEYTKTHKNA